MPLVWLSLAFICGILLAKTYPMTLEGWFGVGLLAIPCLILPALFRQLIINKPELITKVISRFQPGFLQKILRPVNRLRQFRLGIAFPWLILSLSLGAVRYQAVLSGLERDSLANYNDIEASVIVEGIIIEMPEERDGYTNLVVETQTLHLPGINTGQAVEGKLLARLDPGKEWNYGDRVRLEGSLYTPGEDEIFSYREYLAQRGISSQMQVYRSVHLPEKDANLLLAALYGLRARSLTVIYHLYPDPEASLLAGILLGIEQGIPQDVVKAFRTTGTAHIIAISGFNMTLLSGLFSALFTRLFGRWRGALVAVVGIGLYTLLVGANASVVRAAVMGGLSVLAAQLGRRQHGINSLAFTGAVMAAHDPLVLWDIGFQLSVAATLGLVMYGEAWPRYFVGNLRKWLPDRLVRRIKGPVAEYFILTLAAQLMTLPVLIYHFQRLSWVSLLANPVILPIQPALMIVGGLSLLVGLLWLPGGSLIALGGWVLAAFTIRVVEAFASIPRAELLLPPVSLGWVGLFFLVVLAWDFLKSARADLSRLVKPSLVLGILSVLVVQVWHMVWLAPDGMLHLVLLDGNTETRSGEGLLIQSPSGRTVLVNGGASKLRLSDALGRRLAGPGAHLDALVVAGVEENQLQALPDVLPRYPPELAVVTGNMQANYVSRQVNAMLTDQNVAMQRALPGMSLELGDGVQIRVVAASRRGVVLLLEWKRFRALLPLGMDFDNLEELENRTDIRPVTALLLAGSGYAPLNPPQWISVLEPEVILLSVASNDANGLPSGQLLESLQAYNILRTDRNGWIELTTDGEQMWVEVERR